MKNFVFISPHFPDNYWKFCFALKNRGFRVLGVCDAPYNELKEECRYSLDEYYCCSFMDHFDNEVRALEYYQNKYGHIDFIESNNEYWLEKDAHLRDIFGVTTSFSQSEISFLMKKSNQKKFYEEAGLKPARYKVSKNPEELKEFAKLVGYPVFAKPNVGVGAHGTKKIHNEDELVSFANSIPENEEYIFEEFIPGKTVSFDGISNSNCDIIFCTSHYFDEDCASVIKTHNDTMYFCYPKCPEDLEEIGRKCIKAFNVRKRFVHFEFFRLTEDHPYFGKKGTIVPLESNFRPAGGYTPDLINFANSVNVYEIYADMIAYDENRQKMDYEKFYACSSARRYGKNYVHTLDEILSKYHNNVCYYGEFPYALRDDMGDSFVCAKFKTEEELREFDEFVRKKVD